MQTKKSLGIYLILASLAAPAMADEVTYRQHIRPLLEAKCGSCHGAGSPYLSEFQQDKKKYEAMSQGPRMDTYADLLRKRPERVVEQAVKGMIPKNTLGRKMLSKLKVYAGPDHPHAAQQPVPFELIQIAQ